jgi:DCC1-like thiol-disulfide oxidoreductase
MENSAKTSVLYNATCPVCSFEIQNYARYADAKGLPIRFDDLNTDARGQWSLDADTAARRLYVIHKGALTSGIACAAYDFVLAPAIYRWHLRRLRKQPARVQN